MISCRQFFTIGTKSPHEKVTLHYMKRFMQLGILSPLSQTPLPTTPDASKQIKKIHSFSSSHSVKDLHFIPFITNHPTLLYFFFLLLLLLIKSTGQVLLWIKSNSEDKWKKMESDTRMPRDWILTSKYAQVYIVAFLSSVFLLL